MFNRTQGVCRVTIGKNNVCFGITHISGGAREQDSHWASHVKGKVVGVSGFGQGLARFGCIKQIGFIGLYFVGRTILLGLSLGRASYGPN